jgi:hypothetical protein
MQKLEPRTGVPQSFGEISSERKNPKAAQSIPKVNNIVDLSRHRHLGLPYTLRLILLPPLSQTQLGASLSAMALPPEHINIKRRREEEPVDTLCKNLQLYRGNKPQLRRMSLKFLMYYDYPFIPNTSYRYPI